MKHILTSKLMLITFACIAIHPFNAEAGGKFKFKKVSKDVKKEAKRYQKDGWKVEPGNLPIKNQLETAYSRQMETDPDGFPKFIVANGSSVAGTQSAAEMQALELAKNRLVGLIETQMKDVITSDVANDQLDRKDAITLTKTIETSTNTVCKKLGRVLPMFKVYRNAKNNTEVQVLIAYNYEMVRKQILEEMKTELKVETEDQRKKFDKFLSADEYKKGEIRNVSEG